MPDIALNEFHLSSCMFNPFSKKAKDANILKKEFVYLNLYMLVSDKDFGADLMPTLKLILKNKKDMVFEIPGTITEEREDQTIKNHICGATVKMNALNFLNRKDEINEKINNFIDSLPKDMKYDFFISIGIENNAINETSLKILTEASSEFDFLTNQEEKDSNIRIFDSEIRVNNYTIKVKDKIKCANCY